MAKPHNNIEPESVSSTNFIGTPNIYISTSEGTASSDKGLEKLGPDLQEEVIKLVQDSVRGESEKIRRRFNSDLQKQQEKIFTVTAVLTAVLAFIATQAVILKDADASSIIAVSCISTGGLLLFVYVILSVLRDEKYIRKIFYFSIVIILLGIILTGWSPKEILHNARSIVGQESSNQNVVL